MMVENAVVSWEIVCEQLEIARELFRTGRLDEARPAAEKHNRMLATFLAAEEESEPDQEEISMLLRACSELSALKWWQELDDDKKRQRLRYELYAD